MERANREPITLESPKQHKTRKPLFSIFFDVKLSQFWDAVLCGLVEVFLKTLTSAWCFSYPYKIDA